MLIFEYKCKSCLSVFDYIVSSNPDDAVRCVSCDSSDVSRVDSTPFYPKDIFCPHEKGTINH